MVSMASTSALCPAIGDCRRCLAKRWCFVLPSRFEPWGVALHEAVCAKAFP